MHISMENQGRKGILSFQRTRRTAPKSRMNPHGMIAPTEADLKLIRGNLTVRGTYDTTNGLLIIILKLRLQNNK